MVESQPSKLLVAGSIPVSRSILRSLSGTLANELRMASQPSLASGARFEREGRLVGRSATRHAKRSGSAKADVAQLAERVLGKDEVTSSILVIGSNPRSRFQAKVVRRSPKGEGGRDVSLGWRATLRSRVREGCPPLASAKVGR